MTDEPAPVLTASQRAEAWLKGRRRFVLAVVIGASILLRLIYWLEMRNTPCVAAHEWTQTDMHFFHEWSQTIAKGDWLSNGEYHPLMAWQRVCAQQWFDENPDDRANYPGTDVWVLQPNGIKERRLSDETSRALWNHWFGGKQYHQEPLYVYLVAFTYKIFGPNVHWVFLWQMMLGVASNVLIWLLARRYFGDLAGAVAAVFAVFYVPLLFYELALVRTTLTAFIGLALALITDRAVEKSTVRDWFLAGLACGVSLLCQTTFATFIVGSAVILVIKHRKERPRLWKLGVVMAAGVLVGISPFVVRNVIVGAPTLGWASVGPLTFLSDNERTFQPEYGPGGLTPPQVRIMGRAHGTMGPIVVESVKSRGVGGWIALMAQKFSMMWQWYEMPDNQNLYFYRRYSSVLANTPFTFFILSPLALIGLGLAARDFRTCALLYVMIIAGVAVGVLALPLSRYRVPFVAAMIPFAALTVARLAGWAASREWKRFGVTLTAAAVVFIWTARPLGENTPLIRAADYGAPYGYFWAKKCDAATGNPAAQAAIIEESLRVEPPELQRLATRPEKVSRYEMELAGAYRPVYAYYAGLLLAAGRTEEAQRVLKLVQVLAAIAALIPSGRP